jgi:hypothetical protein
MNYMIKTKGKNPNIWPGSHEIKSVWLSYIWWKQQLKEDINIDVAKYNLTLSSFHIKRDRYMNGDWSNSCDGDMGMDLICGLCPLGWGLFVFSLLMIIIGKCFHRCTIHFLSNPQTFAQGKSEHLFQTTYVMSWKV